MTLLPAALMDVRRDAVTIAHNDRAVPRTAYMVLSGIPGMLELLLVPAGPSRVYAAQEKAVLQEFHFILKKVSDRVLKKTAQEVEQTAVAKATASAALAAVPGNLLNHPSGIPSPAPSPRMQQPPSSPFPLGSCTSTLEAQTDKLACN